MTNRIEYQGYVIEPATRQRQKPAGWTLQVRITPAGRRTGTRRCRASNIYPTQEIAIQRCLEFGRQIIDGKLHPKAERTK